MFKTALILSILLFTSSNVFAKCTAIGEGGGGGAICCSVDRNGNL
ncbi:MULTISPECIES: hypothetical protein [Shewanella]|nr:MULTISPECIES: hypothetical protein [Shewanella]